VDCDFNSSWERTYAEEGILGETRERSGKSIRNPDGSETKRFIDIIIHQRNLIQGNDFICLEIKKWNNSAGIEKDINNLKRLTSDYGYRYGFHLILGKTRNKTRWSIFQDGQKITDNERVFMQDAQ